MTIYVLIITKWGKCLDCRSTKRWTLGFIPSLTIVITTIIIITTTIIVVIIIMIDLMTTPGMIFESRLKSFNWLIFIKLYYRWWHKKKVWSMVEWWNDCVPWTDLKQESVAQTKNQNLTTRSNWWFSDGHQHATYLKLYRQISQHIRQSDNKYRNMPNIQTSKQQILNRKNRPMLLRLWKIIESLYHLQEYRNSPCSV